MAVEFNFRPAGDFAQGQEVYAFGEEFFQNVLFAAAKQKIIFPAEPGFAHRVKAVRGGIGYNFRVEGAWVKVYFRAQGFAALVAQKAGQVAGKAVGKIHEGAYPGLGKGKAEFNEGAGPKVRRLGRRVTDCGAFCAGGRVRGFKLKEADAGKAWAVFTAAAKKEALARPRPAAAQKLYASVGRAPGRDADSELVRPA